MNQRLQVQGVEAGPSPARWAGSGLFYDHPITGSADVSFDFSGLVIRSAESERPGGAVGIRLWKEDNNWIELRCVNEGRRKRLEMSWHDNLNGRILSVSESASDHTGRFQLTVDRESGTISASFSETGKWSRTIPGFRVGRYFAAITSYTGDWDTRQPAEILVNVDNFVIRPHR